MSNKIAIFLNDMGSVASLYENGKVKIYEKCDLKWRIVEEMDFFVDETDSMNLVRDKIIKLGNDLGERKVKVFIAKEVMGLVFTVFERLRITSWEARGKPKEFLDYILEKEKLINNSTK